MLVQQLSSEPLVPSSAPVSADLFDPLTPVTMSTGTEQNTTYEAEFADLMGDMDGTQEPQNTSADLDGQPMLDPITVHTEQEDENHIEVNLIKIKLSLNVIHLNVLVLHHKYLVYYYCGTDRN